MASLATLDTRFRPYAETLFRYARALDARFVVTSARRSFQEQAALYHNYLTGKAILPAAPPGRSLHQLGLAFDIAREGIDPRADDLLPRLGQLWQQVGGVWHPSDPVHFQAP